MIACALVKLVFASHARKDLRKVCHDRSRAGAVHFSCPDPAATHGIKPEKIQRLRLQK